MKFVYPEISFVFNTAVDKINTIVIENQRLFSGLIQDVENQLCGYEGKAVVSENDKILSTDKHLELLTNFYPFDLNQKTLLNKISAELEKTAVSGYYYHRAAELTSMAEAFLTEIAFEFPVDISFGKINIGSIIKASGMEIKDTYLKLSEKLIDYFELITEFIGKKLFITVNLRSYISDTEAKEFMETALSHEYNIIMIENCEYTLLPVESRHIIDSDLCEIHR